MKKLILLCVLPYFISSFTFAQDMNQLLQAAGKTKQALEKLKADNINCCDYRHETQCRQTLGTDTGKSFEGFGLKTVFESERPISGGFMPVDAQQTPTGYKVKGLIWQGGTTQYIERTVERVGGDYFWINDGGRRLKVLEFKKSIAPVVAYQDVAVSAAEREPKYTPRFNCILQNAVPAVRDPKDRTETWCEWIGIKEEKLIQSKWYCRSMVSCSQMYGIGKHETEVACEKSNCDTATKCHADPNAYPKDSGIVVVSDGVPLPSGKRPEATK